MMASSGSRSIKKIRIRLANVRNRPSVLLEVSIAPNFREIANISIVKQRKLRTEFFQRYLFLLLRGAIDGSANGYMLDAVLIFYLLNTLVVDKPEERSFKCLKKAQSYMHCALCTMYSKPIGVAKMGYNSENNNYISHRIATIAIVPIFEQQTNGPKSEFRNVSQII